MIRTHIMIVATSLMFALDALAGDAIEFKVVHEQNYATRLKITTKTVGAMQRSETIPPIQFGQTLEQEIRMTCTKVNPDQTAVYDMTLPYAILGVTMGDLRMDFDSRTFDSKVAGPVDKMLNTMFSILTRRHFGLVVDEDGNPIQVRGVMDAMKDAYAKISKAWGVQQASGMFQKMGGLFDDNAWREQMAARRRFVPAGKTLRVGDTWTREWPMQLRLVGAEVLGKGQYAFLAVEEFRGRSCAKIAVRESFRSAPDEKGNKKAVANPFPGMKLDLKESHGKGVAYVDLARGEIVQLRQTQRFNIEMTPRSAAGKNGQPDGGSGKTSMSLDNSISVDLLDGETPGGKTKTP